MLEQRYDIRISESYVDPNPLLVEIQDPDNFTRFQTWERCALEIAAYVFKTEPSQYMYKKYLTTMAAAQKLKIVIFLGSTREGRLGERVSKFVMNSLQEKYELTLFDPVEMQFPMLQKPLHFYPDKTKAPPELVKANDTLKVADAFLFISCEYNHYPVEMQFPMLQKPLHFYPDKTKAPPELVKANDTLKVADAFLFISCEYNHCIPPALLNLVDHFPGSSFSWRPSGLITYSPGIYGGMRSAMQLRALTGEIGCISVSNIFGIPQVHQSIDENGKPLNDHMASGLQKLMVQLDWNAKAMKYMRETEGIPK